jgi:hypothetical protein
MKMSPSTVLLLETKLLLNWINVTPSSQGTKADIKSNIPKHVGNFGMPHF